MLKRLGWVLAVAALGLGGLRLQRQVPRLIEGVRPAGVDVMVRYRETKAWMQGGRFHQRGNIVYPPATYAMLAPVIGWTTRAGSRSVWAGLLLVSLAVTSWGAWRLTAPAPKGWRAFAAALPWSVFPSAYAFSYGQMGPICLAASLWGLLIAPGRASPSRTVAAGALHSLSLMKPSLSVPWVAALAVRPELRRVFAATVAVYGLLTAIGLAPITGPIFERVFGWLEGPDNNVGYGNLIALAVQAGVGRLVLVFGALVLAAFLYWCRSYGPDAWAEWAVGAIVARWAVYHNTVDDGLLLAPMLVMIRHLGERFATARSLVPVLAPFALTCAAMFVPTRLQAAGGLAESVFKVTVMTGYAAALLYFLILAARARRAR